MAKSEWKPGCPIWEESPDNQRSRAQHKRVLAQIIANDHKRLPGTEMVLGWHRELFVGVAPHPDYVGYFRDLDKVPKCCQDAAVHVAGIPGRPPQTVLDDVSDYISEFNIQIKEIDRMWESLKDVKTVFATDRIIKMAAWAHGEWVWIHPFVNGNGRTARLWVSYILLRYGFPPIAVRPRPDTPYGDASMASMRDHDHNMIESVLWQLLFEAYEETIFKPLGET
ncbi:MAG: Fic family protein [Chloroflexota bacterium]|nr:Fic family protein [Chloroflexota bacterium]